VLLADGHDVRDLGTDSEEPVDYPPICAAVGRQVAMGAAERGIVLGGSGQGEQISANKVRGVRAALCNDLYTARYARLHNDANVLSLGARVVGEAVVDEAEELACTRACELFGAEHANVQPHSGANANMAAYMALLEPGATIMGMRLDQGGHLTHGSPVNFSGRLYRFVAYGVDDKTEMLDYDAIRDV